VEKKRSSRLQEASLENNSIETTLCIQDTMEKIQARTKRWVGTKGMRPGREGLGRWSKKGSGELPLHGTKK